MPLSVSLPLPWSPLWFVLLGGLFLYRPKIGLAAFLTFVALFDRNFSYTHLQIGNFPLFLPEFLLLCWSIRCACTSRGHIFELVTRQWPSLARWAWFAFLAIGVIALTRGMATHPIPVAIRDSMIVFYSVMLILIPTLDISPGEIQRFSRWFGSVCLLRVAIIMLMPLHSSSLWMHYLGGQAAGQSMIFSLALLLLFGSGNLHLSIGDLAITIGLSSMVLMGLVRSAWTGLIGGMILLLFCLSREESLRLFARRVFSYGLIVTLGVVFLLNASIIPGGPKRIVKADERYLALLAPARAARGMKSDKRSQRDSASAPAVLLTHEIKVPDVFVSQPGWSPPSSQFRAVLRQCQSCLLGLQSENVSCRLVMWSDAIQEVLSVGLFSPRLTKMDILRFGFPSEIYERMHGNIFPIPIVSDGLLGQTVDLQFFSEEDAASIPLWSWTRVARMLFGLSFGKPFFPPEIIYLVNSPHRFDPHNSFVHLFYRTGFTGILCYGFLLVAVWSRFFSLIRGLPRRDPFYALTATAGACLLYHHIHCLTDNAMENSFKGLWQWIFIGILLAIPLKGSAPVRAVTDSEGAAAERAPSSPAGS